MAKKKPARGADKVPFELAMGELEEIVRRLEGGGGTLDESLDDYSKAIKLLEACHVRLNDAQKRVEILTGMDAEGNAITQPLGNGPDALEEKRAGRSERRSSPTAASRRNTDDSPDEAGLF